MMKLCRFFPQRILAAFAMTAFFVVFAGVSARSQTSGAGSINGTVIDSNQAVIPGASVTVTDTDTGVAHNYTTNSAPAFTRPRSCFPATTKSMHRLPTSAKLKRRALRSWWARRSPSISL